MAENRIYAYCRVSKNDGSMTIENQTHQIEKWAKNNNIKVSAYYKDECKGYTPIEKRSQLPVLLDNLRNGDTVIVVEVSRLHRSAAGLEKVYRIITEEKQAEFITTDDDEKILCTTGTDKDDLLQTSMKKIILTVLATMAEIEKKNISARTKRALAERRSRGKTLGRPEIDIPDNFKELFLSASRGERTHTSVMRDLKMKKATYYKKANELGLKSEKKETPPPKNTRKGLK